MKGGKDMQKLQRKQVVEYTRNVGWRDSGRVEEEARNRMGEEQRDLEGMCRLGIHSKTASK